MNKQLRVFERTIARKVVILDVKEHEPLQLVGIALIVIAPAVSHFLVKHRPRLSGPEPAKE